MGWFWTATGYLVLTWTAVIPIAVTARGEAPWWELALHWAAAAICWPIWIHLFRQHGWWPKDGGR